ncbi:MAG TPA: hypothetical protein VEA60_07100 [Allosphingosinicella sp.]|nr:hypothetical protein [Allosphingosinicella sp.]
MKHERAKAQHTVQERAPWIEPTLSRLKAGSAELLVAVVNDGPGDES